MQGRSSMIPSAPEALSMKSDTSSKEELSNDVFGSRWRTDKPPGSLENKAS
jgi:hypothetical protein